MISFVSWVRKHVGNSAAEDPSDDAEHDRPQDRHVYVHDVFRYNPRDQPNKKIPDQVKHTFPSIICQGGLALQAESHTIFQGLSSLGQFSSGFSRLSFHQHLRLPGRNRWSVGPTSL